MSPHPSARQIKVATDDLRTEATTWSKESQTIGNVSSKIAGLKFNRTEAGIFQEIVNAHSAVIDYASSRTKEGAAAFSQISAALKKAADTYDYEDQHYAAQLKDLW
ncbi:type VII secretion target [Nocardia macrotermitis]|uniref:type VII secretion target n=1 Tax=Nocardia macrotermitis TaxID=2585198 RepID=UPI0012977181|nr:type VII secretion target [Nocardia macrotermitis]